MFLVRYSFIYLTQKNTFAFQIFIMFINFIFAFIYVMLELTVSNKD